jgi:glycosyltransferase involved in cell wall biosynthesis
VLKAACTHADPNGCNAFFVCKGREPVMPLDSRQMTRLMTSAALASSTTEFGDLANPASNVASNVVFNGRFLNRRGTGVDRFASEILRALGELGCAPLEVAVPARVSCDDADSSSAVRLRGVPGGAGTVWEQVALPWHARDRPLVSLCNTGPLAKRDQLVVIHDAATFANPSNFSRRFREWYRLLHGTIMRRARCVATVSAFSANELVRYLGARPAGISVIREGGEHILRSPPDTAIIRRLGLTDRRYILAVGTESPNKNVRAVVAALEEIDDPRLLLVTVGLTNSRVWARAPVTGSSVLSAGYVTDPELRALYENALCFAFPSFYEGFGLPALEAMCCGCPVIVSARASLPEVCGDAALYCDPLDPRTLTAQLRLVLASEAVRSELVAAGRERARVFGWHKGAADVLEAMRELS